MITRRRAIVLSGGLIGNLPRVWASPGEFWNEKSASEWTSEEIDRLLTKSPWAKEAKAELDREAIMARMGGGGRGGMGGRGMGIPGVGIPGGMGGGGGSRGGTGGRGRPQFKAVVRWESALPVRETSRRELPSDAGEYYVISVSGLPSAAAESGGGDTDRLRESTQLQWKGKEPLHPARVEASKPDGATIFYFRREETITREDKEVEFFTKTGPLELKAKFPLKEMVYRGKLEL